VTLLKVRVPVPVPWLLGAALLGACSGGGTTGLVGAKTFRIDSCNLGCTQSGCNISDIAPNQPIIFTFSQNVDPSTVNSATLSFRTSSGAEPVGVYLVNGNLVTFSPQVLISGGATFFGFQTNQTYTLTIRAGGSGPDVLRSTSGDALVADFVCTIRVTKKVVDLDGNPPRGRLAVPTAASNVKRTTDIVVEFSELIDGLPFLAPPVEQPLRVMLSRTRLENGQRVCDPNAQRTLIEGTWNVVNDEAASRTTCRFLNPVELPGHICVAVEVTSRIKDLAGTPAEPQTFQFVTEPSDLTDRTIEENFKNDLQLDRQSSGGDWRDQKAEPAQLGGDGLLGDFDYRHGTEILKDQLYEWSTVDQLIPKDATQSGQNERVTDGVFRFGSFVLPRGVTVRFVGKNPARIHVRGFMDVQGTLVLNGGDLTQYDSKNAIGEPGGAPGAGGGAGGKGGDKADGVAAAPRFNGSKGDDLVLAAGHGYAAQAVGTGGTGSVLFPLSGRNADVTYSVFGFWSGQIAAGGGGGGFTVAGQNGEVLKTNKPEEKGPPAPGGKAFVDLLDTATNPIPPGKNSVEHFLVGGSGGGGGGSHPFFSFNLTPEWKSGAAGAGGGGAFSARVGWNLQLGANSLISARGGSGFDSVNASLYPASGGGGSGGTILLQVGGTPICNGILDVLGGSGGSHNAASFATEIRAGDGSSGLLRLEVVGTPDRTLIGTTRPAAVDKNVARILATEVDRLTGQRSRWYSTNVVFPPEWVRYEVQARVNNTPIVYSDDPSRGRLAAAGEAVQFLVQGANLDSSGNPRQNETGPWRRYVGSFSSTELSLHSDGRLSFRFLLIYDRAVASSIQVTSVKVMFRS
jgi:hypothetical protein